MCNVNDVQTISKGGQQKADTSEQSSKYDHSSASETLAEKAAGIAEEEEAELSNGTDPSCKKRKSLRSVLCQGTCSLWQEWVKDIMTATAIKTTILHVHQRFWYFFHCNWATTTWNFYSTYRRLRRTFNNRPWHTRRIFLFLRKISAPEKFTDICRSSWHLTNWARYEIKF